MVDIANAFAGVPQVGDQINAAQMQRLALQQARTQQETLLRAAQKAIEDQKQLEAAREAAIRNPTRENYARVTLLNPKEHEGIKAAFDMMDAGQRQTELREITAIRSYLRAGRPTEAKAALQRRIDADRKAGQPTTEDEEMLALIDEDLEAAAGIADGLLVGALGLDEWEKNFAAVGKERREEELHPGALKKQTADIAYASAQAAAEPIQAKAQADSAKAALMNAESTAANTQSVIAERLQKQELGPELSPSAQTSINTDYEGAASSLALGARATELADKLAPHTRGADGVFATISNTMGAVLGMQPSEMAQLRKEYQALNIQQAIKNLPPGPASDKDVRMAMRGFPPDNANVEQLISYLRGVAKVQEFSAAQAQARADWKSQNGGVLAPARRGIWIGYDFIEPGTSFGAYQERIFKDRARKFAQDQASPKAPARASTKAPPNVQLTTE